MPPLAMSKANLQVTTHELFIQGLCINNVYFRYMGNSLQNLMK